MKERDAKHKKRQKSQYDYAISDLNTVIQINPKAVSAYNIKGMAHLRKGHYQKAISDFTEAIKTNSQHAEIYYNRGVAHFLKKDYEKAWDDINETQSLGHTVNPEFLQKLREASGRQK